MVEVAQQAPGFLDLVERLDEFYAIKAFVTDKFPNMGAVFLFDVGVVIFMIGP